MLVTGGAGFVGSHVVEHFAKLGYELVVLDNLSRFQLLKRKYADIAQYNWNYLKGMKNVRLISDDVRKFESILSLSKDVDVIVHTAAQTAVTTSLKDPKTDFEVNAVGTFNVLEVARRSNADPVMIYCSTNKVYGNNVNAIPIIEAERRYEFKEPYKNGVDEDFPTSHCKYTPYGVSKLVGDIYVQEYAHTYGLKTGIFRMSCIYGPRQFGVEDQGWMAWFTIATILGKPITIYGNGKQMRDVLYISDLVKAFRFFINKADKLRGEVFNIGGGSNNTLSLLELLDLLEELTGKRTSVSFADWRPSDQRVYISNIKKVKEKLGWAPSIKPRDGIKKLVEWVSENVNLFRG